MTTENTTPTAEIVEVVETDEEKATREEKERQALRFRLSGQMQNHLERIALCLDMLVDTEPRDKAGLEVIARRMRSEFMAALELVEDHKSAGGSYYDASLRPFERLYR